MSPLLNMPRGRGLGRLAARRMGLRGARLRGLRDIFTESDGTSYDSNTGMTVGPTYDTPLTLNPSSGLPISSGSSSGFSSFALTPTESALISQGINVAGQIGVKAVSPNPTLMYNPQTGAYVATGGATLPTSIFTSAALTTYLPYIALAGGLFLLVSMMGRR